MCAHPRGAARRHQAFPDVRRADLTEPRWGNVHHTKGDRTMRPHHRLALGGLAAFAVVTIGFLGFAGSASAASTSAASTSTRAVVAASPSPTQSPDVSERRKIKAGVAFD